ncbi:MAG: hypothetical protein A2W80_14255 [Candidatus Riflebacteria bacterium GWC2_50_8]|nr:MAG: hypothetical protein A2W80_14255 [Candidatus Riflebacteria bacterium GWC2_50_8]
MKNRPKSSVRSHSRKRGFSIAVGLAAGIVVLLAVTNLAFYSSHEIGIVKTMLNIKKADFAAFSGINVVNARLHENRWYQPKRIPNQLQKFKSSHVEKLEDYFKDDKTLGTTVFIDEIPHPKAQKGGAENTDGSIWVEVAPQKRQYRALLDHIRVLSLGTSGDEKSLYFGKFIMVPEPYLADDQSVGHHIESPLEGEDLIPIYPEPVWDNKEEEGFTNKERKGVVSVAIAPGQKVKMGQIIMVLKFYMADGAETTRREQVISPYSGTVKKVLVVPGQDTLMGQPVAFIEKDPGDLYSKKTLRKMVQITKIPLSIFENLDLNKREDRFKVYTHVSRMMLESVLNRVPMQSIRDEVTDKFKNLDEKSLTLNQATDLLNSVGKPQWGVDDIEKMFASLKAKSDQNLEPDIDVNSDYDRIYAQAGKSVISKLWSGFTPDGRLASSTLKKFPEMAKYKLGVQPSNIDEEMLDLLRLISQQHGIDYLKQLETEPQRHNELYNIASTTNPATKKGYWEEMGNKDKLNNGSDNVKDYIKNMSELKSGAKKAVVKLDQGTPWESAPFEQMVADGTANRDDYFWWERKQGWYKKIPKENVVIKDYDIPYGYDNESNPDDPFKMEVNQMMQYFRKHYTFGTTLPPAYDYWAENTITDTPQAPGPPDSTGAKYSGISS